MSDAPDNQTYAEAGIRSVLSDHWLSAIECDHKAALDRPLCACSMVELGWHPSVGQAAEAWIDHVLAVLRHGD